MLQALLHTSPLAATVLNISTAKRILHFNDEPAQLIWKVLSIGIALR
jgi:hypothetical protein